MAEELLKCSNIDVDVRDKNQDSAYFLAVNLHVRLQNEKSLSLCFKIVELMAISKLRDSLHKGMKCNPREYAKNHRLHRLESAIVRRLTKNSKSQLRF